MLKRMAVGDNESKEKKASEIDLGSGLEATKSGSWEKYELFSTLSAFSFCMPGGWNDEDLSIFLHSCWHHLSYLQNVENDENTKWHKIAEFGAKKSTNPTLFSINSCMEIAQCLKSYLYHNKTKMSDNITFQKFNRDVVKLLPYFPPSTHRGLEVNKTDGSVHSEQNPGEDLLEVTLSQLIYQNISLIQEGNPNVWSKLSKDVYDQIGFNTNVQLFLELTKRKIISLIAKESDPLQKKEIFCQKAKNFMLEVFDYIAPISVKKSDFLSVGKSYDKTKLEGIRSDDGLKPKKRKPSRSRSSETEKEANRLGDKESENLKKTKGTMQQERTKEKLEELPMNPKKKIKVSVQQQNAPQNLKKTKCTLQHESTLEDLPAHPKKTKGTILEENIPENQGKSKKRKLVRSRISDIGREENAVENEDTENPKRSKGLMQLANTPVKSSVNPKTTKSTLHQKHKLKNSPINPNRIRGTMHQKKEQANPKETESTPQESRPKSPTINPDEIRDKILDNPSINLGRNKGSIETEIVYKNPDNLMNPKTHKSSIIQERTQTYPDKEKKTKKLRNNSNETENEAGRLGDEGSGYSENRMDSIRPKCTQKPTNAQDIPKKEKERTALGSRGSKTDKVLGGLADESLENSENLLVDSAKTNGTMQQENKQAIPEKERTSVGSKGSKANKEFRGLIDESLENSENFMESVTVKGTMQKENSQDNSEKEKKRLLLERRNSETDKGNDGLGDKSSENSENLLVNSARTKGTTQQVNTQDNPGEKKKTSVNEVGNEGSENSENLLIDQIRTKGSMHPESTKGKPEKEKKNIMSTKGGSKGDKEVNQSGDEGLKNTEDLLMNQNKIKGAEQQENTKYCQEKEKKRLTLKSRGSKIDKDDDEQANKSSENSENLLMSPNRSKSIMPQNNTQGNPEKLKTVLGISCEVEKEASGTVDEGSEMSENLPVESFRAKGTMQKDNPERVKKTLLLRRRNSETNKGSGGLSDENSENSENLLTNSNRTQSTMHQENTQCNPENLKKRTVLRSRSSETEKEASELRDESSEKSENLLVGSVLTNGTRQQVSTQANSEKENNTLILGSSDSNADKEVDGLDKELQKYLNLYMDKNKTKGPIQQENKQEYPENMEKIMMLESMNRETKSEAEGLKDGSGSSRNLFINLVRNHDTIQPDNTYEDLPMKPQETLLQENTQVNSKKLLIDMKRPNSTIQQENTIESKATVKPVGTKSNLQLETSLESSLISPSGTKGTTLQKNMLEDTSVNIKESSGRLFQGNSHEDLPIYLKKTQDSVDLGNTKECLPVKPKSTKDTKQQENTMKNIPINRKDTKDIMCQENTQEDLPMKQKKTECTIQQEISLENIPISPAGTKHIKLNVISQPNKKTTKMSVEQSNVQTGLNDSASFAKTKRMYRKRKKGMLPDRVLPKRLAKSNPPSHSSKTSSKQKSHLDSNSVINNVTTDIGEVDVKGRQGTSRGFVGANNKRFEMVQEVITTQVNVRTETTVSNRSSNNKPSLHPSTDDNSFLNRNIVTREKITTVVEESSVLKRIPIVKLIDIRKDSNFEWPASSSVHTISTSSSSNSNRLTVTNVQEEISFSPKRGRKVKSSPKSTEIKEAKKSSYQSLSSPDNSETRHLRNRAIMFTPKTKKSKKAVNKPVKALVKPYKIDDKLKVNVELPLPIDQSNLSSDSYEVNLTILMNKWNQMVHRNDIKIDSTSLEQLYSRRINHCEDYWFQKYFEGFKERTVSRFQETRSEISELIKKETEELKAIRAKVKDIFSSMSD